MNIRKERKMKMKKSYNYKKLLLSGIIYFAIFSTFIIAFADFVITPDTFNIDNDIKGAYIKDISTGSEQSEGEYPTQIFVPKYLDIVNSMPSIPQAPIISERSQEVPWVPIPAEVWSFQRPRMPLKPAPLIIDEIGGISKRPLPVTDANAPTIKIESINAEYRNDPDYVTYEITLVNPTYTVIENGVRVEKRFANIINGTISIKKGQSIESFIASENK